MPDCIAAFILAVRAYLSREDGQTLTEYALLVVFIALAVVLAISMLGAHLLGLFNSVANVI